MQLGAGEAQVDYHLNAPLKLYSNHSDMDGLVVRINEGKSDEYAMHLWVDWNDNGRFEEESSANELRKTSLREDQTIYTIPLQMPQGVAPGKYRMRLMVGKKDEIAACPTSGMTMGDVKDFTLELLQGAYPVECDLGLTNLEVNSGGKLSDSEKIAVTVQNRSAKPVAKCKLSYTINGPTPATVEEEATMNIPAFGEASYTFTKQADLSKKGVYDITASVKIDGDVNPQNDVIATQVYSVMPEEHGFYALKLTPGESIELGSLGNMSFDENFTIEFWINLNDAPYHRILEGKGLLIEVQNDPARYGNPPNCLQVKVNDQYYCASENPVITPGQWQHVVVVVEADPPYHPYVGIYLNGEDVDTKHNDAVNSFIEGSDAQSLRIAPEFSGMIDMLRFWSVENYDVAEEPYKRYREPDGTLPDGLVAEFCFDEGPGNPAAISGDLLARIESRRIAPGTDLWVKPNRLVHTVRYADEVIPTTREEVGGKATFTVTLPKVLEMQKNALEGAEFLGTWPNTTFSYSGNPVEESTKFDFSSGFISIDAAVSGLFGYAETLKEEVVVKALFDKSAECDIVELKLNPGLNNPGLAAEVAISNPESHLELDLKAHENLKGVKFALKLSPGATASYNGLPFENEKTAVDFTKPVVLKVLAEDRRSEKKLHPELG